MFHTTVCDSINNNDYEKNKNNISIILPFGDKIKNINDSKKILIFIFYLLNKNFYIFDRKYYEVKIQDVYIMMIDLFDKCELYLKQDDNGRIYNINYDNYITDSYNYKINLFNQFEQNNILDIHYNMEMCSNNYNSGFRKMIKGKSNKFNNNILNFITHTNPIDTDQLFPSQKTGDCVIRIFILYKIYVLNRMRLNILSDSYKKLNIPIDIIIYIQYLLLSMYVSRDFVVNGYIKEKNVIKLKKFYWSIISYKNIVKESLNKIIIFIANNNNNNNYNDFNNKLLETINRLDQDITKNIYATDLNMYDISSNKQNNLFTNICNYTDDYFKRNILMNSSLKYTDEQYIMYIKYFEGCDYNFKKKIYKYLKE